MGYTGAYSQTMVIHAFCNVDDVSWGTKGTQASGGKKYESDKVFFVGSWKFIINIGYWQTQFSHLYFYI